MLASLVEMLTNIAQEGVVVAKQVIGRLSWGSPGDVRKKGHRRSAIYHLKGRCAVRRVEGSVVAVLRPSKPVDLGARAISRRTA